MEELKVRDIMQTDVLVVGPEASVRELADILAQNKISGVPVVDAEQHVIGMVSEADVIVQDADLHFPTTYNSLTASSICRAWVNSSSVSGRCSAPRWRT